MSDFFRFPHTPHLNWLGEGAPRDDKVMSPNEMEDFLAGGVVVEEKLDGANLGFSLAPDGSLRVQNRGQYLVEPYGGQFARLSAWLVQHGEDLHMALSPNLIFFGEWCAARHSLDYEALPDWFMFFDVYDRIAASFWSSSRRNELAKTANLASVPSLMSGKTSLSVLKQLVVTESSKFRLGPLEGLVVRRESSMWCERRAKLVRPDFIQAINSHWRKRALEWNRLGGQKRTL